MAEAARLLLGVNGGDTTEAVIATLDGTVVGRGLGPASNHHRVGLESAQEALRTAIERAVAQVLVRRGGDTIGSMEDVGISAACFGLSGVDDPQDEQLFSSWLKT